MLGFLKRKKEKFNNKELYLIVGLGNPGREYEGTRHNIGFDAADEISRKFDIPINKNGNFANYGKGKIAGKDVIIVKPVTYMNDSGKSVGKFANFYKLEDASKIIIISDDSDLEVGKIRIRAKGSSGGHNGLKSIIKHLGCEDFTRIRLGVGHRPQGYSQIDWVLGHFNKEDAAAKNKAVAEMPAAVKSIIEDGIQIAMTRHNSKKRGVK